MKIREGYELKQVGDEYVVITVGESVKQFNGMIRLNKSGEYVWNELQKGTELDNLIDHFAIEYGIDHATAETDVKAFIDIIRQTNCFAE